MKQKMVDKILADLEEEIFDGEYTWKRL
jgi:hypothetical protein